MCCSPAQPYATLGLPGGGAVGLGIKGVPRPDVWFHTGESRSGRSRSATSEAEAGRRTFSNICVSRTARVCIVAIALQYAYCLFRSFQRAFACLFLPRQPSANFVLAKLPHWDVKVLLILVLGVLASKKMLPWLLPLLLGLLPPQYFRLPHFCLFVSGVCFPEILWISLHQFMASPRWVPNLTLIRSHLLKC